MHAPARFVVFCWLAPALILAAGPVCAQEVTAPPADELAALEARASRFLESVSLDQTQAAYDELLSGSPLVRQEKALKALVDKTEQLDDKYGKYRSFERLRTKPIGRDLVLIRHLYKCEDFPVVWYFTFYRTAAADQTGGSSWRVISVRFDTDLELLDFID